MAVLNNTTLCSVRPSSGLDPTVPIVVNSLVPNDIPINHILVKVDQFGFSANNITYQALGEHPEFRYFDFHAVPESDFVTAKTHGLVPVWGYGTVESTNHPKISIGERLYGYFSPSRYLFIHVSPTDVNKHAFYVLRSHLPPDRRPYNQIIRCATDPLYIGTPQAEDLSMLFRPLFWTSYWCEDWLRTSNYRGASSVIISSASSKTAFCLAYVMGKTQLPGVTNIVGLTSKRNLEFTKQLRLYTDVYDYESFSSSDLFGQPRKWLYVDVAGNANLNGKILQQLSSSLVGCVTLGFTNLTPSSATSSISTMSESGSPSSGRDLKFEQFFTPTWIDIRRRQLPNAEIFIRQKTAWEDLMKDCVHWVRTERVYGGDAVQKSYRRIVHGELGPETGLIWSMWDGDDSEEPPRSRL